MLINNFDIIYHFAWLAINTLQFISSKSKEEGKDQELIQSNTKPDLGHHMGKWK